jgi:hypothetical protein
MIIRTSFLIATLWGLCWGVSSMAKPAITVKGIVVAFHQQDRALKIKEAQSIGNPLERWIFRVDKSTTDVPRGLILVLYMRSGNGVSDDNINTGGWELNLRRARKEELQDCVGNTLVSEERLKARRSRTGDFEKTSLGAGVVLPDLRYLPCFVTVAPPVPASLNIEATPTTR